MAKKGADKSGKVTKGKTSTAKRKTRTHRVPSQQPATTSTDWDDVDDWDD